jgi:hypothetical protein
MDIRIVVLQRGWVHIGVFSRDGDTCTLQPSYTIRRWGTSAGLGQLANDGPTTDTILDADGRGGLHYHVLSYVEEQVCDESKWSKYF